MSWHSPFSFLLAYWVEFVSSFYVDNTGFPDNGMKPDPRSWPFRIGTSEPVTFPTCRGTLTNCTNRPRRTKINHPRPIEAFILAGGEKTTSGNFAHISKSSAPLWAILDSNQWPLPCEGSTLTNWANRPGCKTGSSVTSPVLSRSRLELFRASQKAFWI